MKKKSKPSTTSKTDLIAFRCPVALKEKMVKAVEDGRYQSLTELTVEAVTEKLKNEPVSGSK